MELSGVQQKSFLNDLTESSIANTGFILETTSNLLKKKENFLSDLGRESKDESDKAKSTINLLKNIIEGYEEKTSNYNDFSSDQRSAIDSITAEIKKIVIDAEEKGPKVTEIDENTRAIESKNKNSSKELSVRELSVNDHLDNIKQQLNYFEEYLGLKVERYDSYLRFSLSCVDDSDVDCHFSLKVTGDLYEVLDVDPEVNDLEQVVNELNKEKENNPKALRMFFCKMRKLFQISLLTK